MKYLKKFAVILCAAVLLLCMTSCAGAGSSISVPKGHVPTISEILIHCGNPDIVSGASTIAV